MQDDLVERVAVELIAMRLASYDDQARAIIPLVLEEAAKIVESLMECDGLIDTYEAAVVIRAIGAKP
jgi:hypothetical protein